jgi:hypothetical protein
MFRVLHVLVVIDTPFPTILFKSARTFELLIGLKVVTYARILARCPLGDVVNSFSIHEFSNDVPDPSD